MELTINEKRLVSKRVQSWHRQGLARSAALASAKVLVWSDPAKHGPATACAEEAWRLCEELAADGEP